MFLHPDQDLYHASKIFCGMRALQRRGDLSLRVVKANPWNLDDLTVGMIVHDGNVSRKVAFDVRDRSDYFHEDALEECDVYFKRGYYFPNVDHLQSTSASKVLPYGLTYGCRGYGITRLMLGTLFSEYAIRSLSTFVGQLSGLRSTVNRIRKFLASPEANSFEVPPTTPTEPVVLFQTRVWAPEETTDDHDDINESRVSVVRALRKAFGDRFWGGLVPTAYALQKFPDLITPFSTRRNEYISLTHRATIGVYSRGLHYSNACKLPEYLASSKAIVSDYLRQELPTPLREGTNFLGYHTPEECVERCAELMRDPDQIQAMREANFRYYLKEVEPATHMWNRLTQALAFTPRLMPTHVEKIAA